MNSIMHVEALYNTLEKQTIKRSDIFTVLSLLLKKNFILNNKTYITNSILKTLYN